MSMQKFLQAADPIYKNPISSFPLTDTDKLALTADVPKLYAIPSNTEILLFQSTKDFYVLFGDSTVVVEVPDEYDILDGSAPMLNPEKICNVSFSNYTHVSIISESNCAVFVQRWSRR